MHAMADTLSTVTAYWRREDAGIAQQVLDHAGIESVVEESMVSKVRVAQPQALRAGEVLNRDCDNLAEVGEADEESQAQVCPECDSVDVKPAMRARTFVSIAAAVIAASVAVEQTAAAFFLLATIGVTLLIGQRWRCEHCGARWD
jgi:hypothetical protein